MDAMSGAALSVSLMASEDAGEAKKISCRTFMRDYKDSSSTVEYKQQYAKCVKLIYPTDEERLAVAFFLFLLICCLAYLFKKYVLDEGKFK